MSDPIGQMRQHVSPACETLLSPAALTGTRRRAYQKAYDRDYSSRREWRRGCVTADHRATGGRSDSPGTEPGLHAQH
jgi:hypothetical protein